jgi:acylglycerol lipase
VVQYLCKGLLWRHVTDHIDSTWHTPDGCQLFVQSWGPEGGARAIVCLVHGLGEHSGRYAHVAAALCSAGYTLFAFDLRGHGRSEGLRGHTPSYDRLMDDIHEFLGKASARYPGKPRFLYGHSLGGSLVLNYVLRRKPRLAGVIATSPGLRPAIAPPGWKLTTGRLMYKVRPTFQMPNGLDLGGLSHDPAVIRAYTADPLCHDRLSAQLGLDILSSGEYALTQANRFPLPLLLMHGNSDRLTSCTATRDFAAALPGDRCTFREWDGCYHELHNEPQQADVLRTIITWLDAHMPAVAPVKVADGVQTTPKSGGRKKKRR